MFIIQTGVIRINLHQAFSTSFIEGKVHIFIFFFILIFFEKKIGDFLGIQSFLTNEPREGTATSEGFSTLFEIKLSDFLRIIKKYDGDYVNFS